MLPFAAVFAFFGAKVEVAPVEEEEEDDADGDEEKRREEKGNNSENGDMCEQGFKDEDDPKRVCTEEFAECDVEARHSLSIDKDEDFRSSVKDARPLAQP